MFLDRTRLLILYLTVNLPLIMVTTASVQPSNDHKIKNKNSTQEISSLIVVDVQNCFISGNLALIDSPAKQEGADVVPIINHLLQTVSFDVIIYTHDWHPTDHISFYQNLNKRRQYLLGDQNKNYSLFDTVTYKGPLVQTEQVLWPLHCIQNTNGAKLHKDLIVESKSNVFHVRKGLNPDVDSYSAFWDNNKQQKTDLDSILRRWNVTHVYVTGLATDYCVAATALDAIDLKYTTYLVEDACRGVSLETIDKKKQEMKQRGITFVQSSQVKALVDGAICNRIYLILMSFSIVVSFLLK
ncbi:unnamed protein product [Adineta ricciae]|nr:unnamed protein product [Adineta ricciae]